MFLGEYLHTFDSKNRISMPSRFRKELGRAVIITRGLDHSLSVYARKAWEKQVGRNTSVKWPTGLGAKGNEGVAGQVKQLPGTIGYVELAYAHQNKLPFAEIKNASGKFISPSVESVTEALGAASVPDDFRFSMVNPAGEKAYPIAGATWLLVYQQQPDAVKGKKLVEFLDWALTKGEAAAGSLDYAPLPAALQQRVLERIKAIKY